MSTNEGTGPQLQPKKVIAQVLITMDETGQIHFKVEPDNYVHLFGMMEMVKMIAEAQIASRIVGEKRVTPAIFLPGTMPQS
jgi:hypothetical protein